MSERLPSPSLPQTRPSHLLASLVPLVHSAGHDRPNDQMVEMPVARKGRLYVCVVRPAPPREVQHIVPIAALNREGLDYDSSDGEDDADDDVMMMMGC